MSSSFVDFAPAAASSARSPFEQRVELLSGIFGAAGADVREVGIDELLQLRGNDQQLVDSPLRVKPYRIERIVREADRDSRA